MFVTCKIAIKCPVINWILWMSLFWSVYRAVHHLSMINDLNDMFLLSKNKHVLCTLLNNEFKENS